MNDDYPPATPQRTWLDKISHFLTGDPQDLDDLVEILREARTRSLLDFYYFNLNQNLLNLKFALMKPS